MSTARYAIYFVPRPETELHRFGASVLGHDCYTGDEVKPLAGSEAFAWAEIVREPRVYGFHATLKAPFRLAEGFSEAGLEQAVFRVASALAPVDAGELVLREIGAFIALVPRAQSPALNHLAETCVQAFDRFRAPMTDADRARRLASKLNARQIEYLDRWGYPYVFDEFRFHMTLTGPLAPSDRAQALRFLGDEFARRPKAQSLTIDQVVVARQPEPAAHFHVLCQAALKAPDAH
jgi:putative phosphonate metabolism protein